MIVIFLLSKYYVSTTLNPHNSYMVEVTTPFYLWTNWGQESLTSQRSWSQRSGKAGTELKFVPLFIKLPLTNLLGHETFIQNPIL